MRHSCFLAALLTVTNAFAPHHRARIHRLDSGAVRRHSRGLGFSEAFTRSKVLSSETRHKSSSGALSSASASEEPSGEEESSEKKEEAPANVLSATFGLMKAILGSGALALPAGLAAMADYPQLLWPANIMLAGLGVLSAYTFSLYGRLAYRTGARNLGDMWQRVQNTDKSLLVSAANFVYCFGCCLTFSLIIGDSMSGLLRGAGITGWLARRQSSILVVTTAALWRLCNLKSLAALAPVSIVGVLGTFVATAFVAFRCPAVLKSSPYAIAGEGLLASSPMQPLFCSYNRLRSPAPLVLMAMACVAWMAHFGAPEFYHSLKGSADDPDEKKKAIAKYNLMTLLGYSSVAAVNAMLLSFGFLTFGGNCAGIVLNNYSTLDPGAALSRLLIMVSVIGGFPFLFGACRSAALDLFASGKEVTDSLRKKATAILLAVITAISLIVEDAGFVVSFNGALMGTAIIYIFPALLFLKETAGRITSGWVRLERWFSRFLVVFGSVSAILGAVTSVLNSYFPHLLT
jgi:amino acid permease